MNKICFSDTTVSVWEEKVNEGDFKSRVFIPVIRFLGRRGWKVTLCPETKKRYSCLSKYTRIAQKGELHARIEIRGRHLEVEIWQDLYNRSRTDSGRWEFDKRNRMPYLLGKRCDLEIQKLVAFLQEKTGYPVENKNPILGNADRAIQHSILTSGHYKPELGHASFSMECNRTSADKQTLKHGQTVWTTDRKGRVIRGKAFYSLNSQWMIRLSHDNFTYKSAGELWVSPPPDLRQKRNEEVRRCVLEGLLSNAVDRMDFQRADQIKNLLFGKDPLFRIWSKKHEAYYRPNACGYTNDKSAAGLYRRDEAERLTSHTDSLAIRPVYSGELAA